MYYIRYFGAQIYDVFILVALFFAYTAACLMVRHGLAIPPHSHWYQASLFAIVYLYYIGSYQSCGQTIGMRSWHTRLISLDKPLRQKQILGRFFLSLPALVWALVRCTTPGKVLRQWTKSEIVMLAK